MLLTKSINQILKTPTAPDPDDSESLAVAFGPKQEPEGTCFDVC